MTARDVRADIRTAALSWLGTPYHHEAAVKGPQGGVDCAMLLVAVYVEVGLVPADLDPRPYSPQWHLHRCEEQYLQWLERYARPTDTPAPGDVAVWRFGRTFSHGGILIDAGHVVHALMDSRRVTLHGLHDYPLQGRPVRFFTLVEGEVHDGR